MATPLLRASCGANSPDFHAGNGEVFVYHMLMDPDSSDPGSLNLASSDDRSLLQAFIANGRPLLVFAGLCLVLTGLFAFFQASTGHFLPHDVDFLGMTERELCLVNE